MFCTTSVQDLYPKGICKWISTAVSLLWGHLWHLLQKPASVCAALPTWAVTQLRLLHRWESGKWGIYSFLEVHGLKVNLHVKFHNLLACRKCQDPAPSSAAGQRECNQSWELLLTAHSRLTCSHESSPQPPGLITILRFSVLGFRYQTFLYSPHIEHIIFYVICVPNIPSLFTCVLSNFYI